MLRRHFLQSMLLTAGAPLLGACAPATEPLRFGANAWPGYAPLRLASVSDLIGRESLRVLDFPSTSMVLSAFRNGLIDLAGLTLDEAMMLAVEEQAPRIVLVFDTSIGADAILAQPHIKSVTQLVGARVGVETEAVGAYMIGRALGSAGLPAERVEIVSMPHDAHETAFLSGAVDALVTFDPVRTRLLARGANELFSSRDIPGEIVDVMVVRESELARRRDDVARVVAAHFAARALMLASPDDTVRRLGPRIGLSEDELAVVLTLMDQPDASKNRVLLGEGAGSLLPVLDRMGSVMHALGLISHVPNLNGILMSDLIPSG